MFSEISRRQAIRWAGAAAMATNFLPMAGRHRGWVHAARKKLKTRAIDAAGKWADSLSVKPV